jgi:hypothetical protein
MYQLKSTVFLALLFSCSSGIGQTINISFECISISPFVDSVEQTRFLPQLLDSVISYCNNEVQRVNPMILFTRYDSSLKDPTNILFLRLVSRDTVLKGKFRSVIVESFLYDREHKFIGSAISGISYTDQSGKVLNDPKKELFITSKICAAKTVWNYVPMSLTHKINFKNLDDPLKKFKNVHEIFFEIIANQQDEASSPFFERLAVMLNNLLVIQQDYYFNVRTRSANRVNLYDASSWTTALNPRSVRPSYVTFTISQSPTGDFVFSIGDRYSSVLYSDGMVSIRKDVFIRKNELIEDPWKVNKLLMREIAVLFRLNLPVP